MLLHMADRERHHCQFKEEKRLDNKAVWVSLQPSEKPFTWGPAPIWELCLYHLLLPPINGCWRMSGAEPGERGSTQRCRCLTVGWYNSWRWGYLRRDWCQAQARRDRGQFSGQLMLSSLDLRTNMCHAQLGTGAWWVNTTLALVKMARGRWGSQAAALASVLEPTSAERQHLQCWMPCRDW